MYFDTVSLIQYLLYMYVKSQLYYKYIITIKFFILNLIINFYELTLMSLKIRRVTINNNSVSKVINSFTEF